MTQDQTETGRGEAAAPPAGPPGDAFHPDPELPQTRPSRLIDGGLIRLGKAVSWLWLAVTGVIIWAVVGRYAFSQGSVALEEMQWHLVGSAWLLGLSYTLATDEHVRVDVLRERFGLRTQCWVEFLGITLLLVPFLLVAFREAIPFAADAFRSGERSVAPAGLAHRWIVKAVMAFALGLLLVAALSRLLRVTAVLFGFPRPVAAQKGKGGNG